MSRRFSTGTCPKDIDDAMMAVLPEDPNNSFRSARRQSCPDRDEEGTGSLASPARRRMLQRQSCLDPDKAGVGQMRRTLQKLRNQDSVKEIVLDGLTDEGRLSERFQSNRTSQLFALSDVARPKLDRIELFRQCTPSFLEALVHQLQNVFFDAGHEIIKQGDIGTNMFLLNFGEVEVVVGESQTVVATLGSGAVFGEMAVISKSPIAARRNASIWAKTPCHCWSIDRPALLKLFSTYPKDEVVISAEADRRLQDLIRKGFIKDSDLETKATSRPPSKNGLNYRVRNKLRAINALAKLGRPSVSDDNGRQSYESAVSRGRSTFDESGRETSRRTFEDHGRCTYEEDAAIHTPDRSGHNSYESTPRVTLENIGRKTSEMHGARKSRVRWMLDDEDLSIFACSMCDESRTSYSATFEKPFKNRDVSSSLVQDVTRMLFLPNSSDAMFVQEPASESLVLGAPKFTDEGAHESHFFTNGSECNNYMAGWASPVSPPYRLPSLRQNHQKYMPSQGWRLGETWDITKARSTAQSFLAEPGIEPMKPSQQKSIPINMLFDCLHSQSVTCN